MSRDKLLVVVFAALPIVGIVMFIVFPRLDLPLPIIIFYLIVALVFTLASPLVAARFWARHLEARKDDEREILAQVKGLIGELEPGKTVSSVHEGVPFEYSLAPRKAGKQKQPASFYVSICCISDGSFKITKEATADKLFKKLGIACEIQTGDREFDKDFFIHTDTVQFTTDFFRSLKKREAVREIRQLGFNSIEHDGSVMKAIWSPFAIREDMDRAFVTDAVSQLAVLSRDLPAFAPAKFLGRPTWKITRTVVTAVPTVGVVGGSLLYLWGNAKYPPLDWSDIMLASLKYSLLSFIVFSFLALLLIRGRSNSHRELMGIIPLSLFGFPAAGAALALFLNGWLDTSPPSPHEVAIVKKRFSVSSSSSSSRRRVYYYIETQSWRSDHDVEVIKVSSSQYQSLVGKITVVTKKGRFSFEWLYQIDDRQ